MSFTIRQFIVLTTVLGIFGGTLSGCSSGDAYQASNKSLGSSGILALTPSTNTLGHGQSVQFQATGGSGNYRFMIYGGTGQISATGAYIAPAVDETDTIEVLDSAGNEAFAIVTVGAVTTTPGSSALAISPAALTVTHGTTTTFTATGGGGSYVFKIYQGNGAITSAGVYTAPSLPGTDYIVVTDATGGNAFSTVTIQ